MFPEMEIKRKLRAIFQLVTRSPFWNLLTDLTWWLHSELQTIIYIDLSLTALSTSLSCLCLSLPSLFSTSAFNLSSSSSFSFFFHSKILKIQVTLLNNISRKSFDSSHYKLHIMGYRITYLTCNSASLLLLPSSLLTLLLILTLKCQEIACVKH